MQYTTLGARTNNPVRVSRICLGTMTWGEQNTESEAHDQLDCALERGVNFIDTAEMYPVPPEEKTAGRTEAYIGSWLKKNAKRNQIILATKVVGPSQMTYLRSNPDLDKASILSALEGSLRRLGTDYIDLYQLHWPSRPTNNFGVLNYMHSNKQGVALEESLGALVQLVQSGKIRHIGLSNETPWGVMEAKRICNANGWQQVVSIQNPYNLLNRTFEIGLSEVAIREDVPLLAYSPLAFGALSGKYVLGTATQADRLNRYTRFGRYTTDKGVAATKAFVALAQEFELTPATLALAFVNTRPFVASNIIGATSLEQLTHNIDSINVTLTPAQVEAIEAVSTEHANPCP